MNDTRSRVLFYVQHLLGVGHVRRASLIANAMAEAGLDVHVVLGGTPVSGIRFDGCTCHTLPEAKAVDASFSGLLDDSGNPVDDAWRDRRRETLLSLYADLGPQVLIIEQFPFGRRQFRFELLPLLETAVESPDRPYIACSVRDILVSQKTPEREQQIADYVDRYFDSVIVHGDPTFMPFESTFPSTHQFMQKLHYTGYVAPPELAGSSSDAGTDEVIVAAGGGAVGAELLICAAKAKAGSNLSHLNWRFLTGPNLPNHVTSTLRQINDPSIIVEPNRDDYGTLLQNCTLSISQGGYNTMMDIIRAKCPAVVVPFGSGNEDEQRLRTRTLHNQGFVTILDDQDMTPETMATSINLAAARIFPQRIPFSLDGAPKTASFIAKSAT